MSNRGSRGSTPPLVEREEMNIRVRAGEGGKVDMSSPPSSSFSISEFKSNDLEGDDIHAGVDNTTNDDENKDTDDDRENVMTSLMLMLIMMTITYVVNYDDDGNNDHNGDDCDNVSSSSTSSTFL